jgi:hypothetical protein
VACVGQHHELRVGDRLLELVGDAQRRAGVVLAPDQEGRHGHGGQQVVQVGLGHQ